MPSSSASNTTKMLTWPKRRLLCTGAESISANATAATTVRRRDGPDASAAPTGTATATTAAHVASIHNTCTTGSATSVIGQSTSAANGG